MNQIIKFLIIAVAFATAMPSFAVSDQEMEQARTLAAKHYLRYANNGSDYLDKLNPSSISELSKSLKAKEQENIKSFNSVPVPKDYASWDKAKLVEFWSNTFFKSSALKEDGKKCLGILAKNIAKIQVSANPKPEAKSEPAAAENKQEQNQPQVSDANQPTPVPETLTSEQTQEEILEDTPASEEQTLEEDRPQKSSGTAWYVAILIILVGVVVWLVMYAQKSMKESGQIMADHKKGEKEIREIKKNAKEEVNKLREQYAASIAAKNDELKQLREKCESLQSEVEELRHQLEHKSMEAAKVKPAPQAEITHKDTQHQSANLPPVVYLGYVNQRGLFVKASRSLNTESTVYRMDIPDGEHGSFRVVTDPSILDRLISDPEQWLAGGCDIENPEDADIATEIINIAPGQALFADNSCRVVKKAHIKFI